jgi:ATP-binding cassette subfamily F protein 3
LDEPTNHLDIRSKDILKRALIDYEGTVIMVSHDRDFMKGICNRLFEFRDGHVKEHLCDIEEFMQIRKVERLNELDLEKKQTKEAKTQQIASGPTEKEIETKQLKNQLKKIEEAITNVEGEIKKADEQLSNPSEYEKLMNDPAFFKAYNGLKNQLEKLMTDWEELSAKL